MIVDIDSRNPNLKSRLAQLLRIKSAMIVGEVRDNVDRKTRGVPAAGIGSPVDGAPAVAGLDGAGTETGETVDAVLFSVLVAAGVSVLVGSLVFFFLLKKPLILSIGDSVGEDHD